jgi:uncharacterized protein (DUF58 family)
VSATQFTSLLPNDVLSRVERMRVTPLKRNTNRTHGEHLSGKGGTSIEFSDYREYSPGDDLRYVDWNIFSRLNQPYLKLYAHEEEMHIPILLDASTSMSYEGKFQLARQVAACLGVMGLYGVERVSVYSCSDRAKQPVVLKPAAGRPASKRFIQFLERLQPGGEFPIEKAIEEMLVHHHGRGVAFIISDFLTFGDMGRALNMLSSAGLEIDLIQILGPAEINPELAGDFRFVDSETNQTVDVSSVGELLGLYHEHRQALESYLAAESRRRKGRFLTLSSATDIKTVLFEHLVRGGWVR